MPNIKITNTIPNSYRKTDTPNSRVSSFQTGTTGLPTLSVGMPIGLLLTLTYSAGVGLGSFSDFRPSSRIVNT